MKIGLCQLLVEGTEPDRNIERAERMVRQAVEEGCDIVLLPETMDFAWTHPDALKEAESIPGKYSDKFCELSKELGVMICVGLTEKTNKGNFNTALLIDPELGIILKYHKINLLEVEFPFYQIGDRLGVVDTKFGKIGVNICADNYIDGLAIGETLARMGAQIILSPSSWTVDYLINEDSEPYIEKWLNPYSKLANMFGITVIGTTSVGYIVGGPYEGKKSVGCSLAVGPKGVIHQGNFNEFAGELSIIEFDVDSRSKKGTQIGKHLVEKGFRNEYTA